MASRPAPSVDPRGESSARGGFSPEPGLSLGRHRGCDLNLQPESTSKGVDGLLVIVECESMADHGLAVDDTPHHQCQRPFEAVEHRHRPDDPDLVPIDVEPRKPHPGLTPPQAEDQEMSTPPPPAETHLHCRDPPGRG